MAIEDSGERTVFDSGMVRDTATGKIDFTLALDGPMFDRWAEHLTRACVNKDGTPSKYPPRNWMLARGEKELERFRVSAMRHMRDWMRGKTNEDHAAAVFFNINGYEYLKAKMDAENKV